MSRIPLYICTCITVIGLLHNCSAPQSPTFGTIEILIPERIEQCKRQNNLISDLENCCGFLRCVSGYLGSPYFYNGVYGIKMDCPASTIWHPELCLCVSRDVYTIGCPIENCAFRDADGTCGEFLDEDECCLEQLDIHQAISFEDSQIYKRINDTHYEFRGDTQGCPEGQIFYLDACCCEGMPTVSGQECLHYPFDDRKIINNRGLISKGVRTTPNQEGVFENGIGLYDLYDSTITIDAYTAVNQYTFFACIWVKFDANLQPGIIFHNGLDAGAGATVMLELIMTDLGEWLIVGGVRACDRVEDLVLLAEASDIGGKWIHICLSLNRTGFVNIYYNGTSFSILERDRLGESDFEEIMLAVINDIELLASADYGDPGLNDLMNNELVNDMNAYKDIVLLDFLDWMFYYDKTVRTIVKWITNLHTRKITIAELQQFFDHFLELRDKTTFEIQNLDFRIENVLRAIDSSDLSSAAELMADLVAKKLDRLRYMIEQMDPMVIDEDDGTISNPVDIAVGIGIALTGRRKKRDAESNIDGEDPIDPDYLRVLMTSRPLKEWVKYVLTLEEFSLIKEFVLDESRKNERAKDFDKPTRAKRNNVEIPGDPLVLRIMSSKQPLRLGDGFIGELDEFVLCDFVPDQDAISALYESNVIPTQPLGVWHV